MATPNKIATVSALSEKFSRAKSVVSTDYQGLTHKQLEELHAKLRAVNGEYVVAKNSLLKLSGKLTATGPTAVLFAYGDELAPIQVLFKFIKTFQLPRVKEGIIASEKYDGAQIEAIAKLPSKSILQSQLVSRLNSPIYSFVYTLNANLQKLAFILKEVSNRV
jgi:ribosomal protein L10